MHRLDPKTIAILEDRLTNAIAEVMRDFGKRTLPLVPNPPTIHLMAKAATTVYESAVENATDGSE